MRRDSPSISLSPKSGKQVEDKREHDAKQDGTRQRKIDRSMFAAPRYIAGQTTEGNSGLSEKQNQTAEQQKEYPEADKHAAEIIHNASLEHLL